MKVINYCLMSTLLISSYLNTSYAKDYPIYLGIGGSVKNYEYSIDDKIKNNTYVSDTLPSIKYSVGYIGSDNKFSVSLFGDNIINKNQYSPVGFFSDNTNAKLKRDDYGINIAYNLTSKVSIIGGYRYGITSIDYKESNENDEIKTYGPYVGVRYLLFNKGNDRIFSSLNYNLLSTDFTKNETDEIKKINFDGQGYALSLGWSHYLGNNNSLYIAGEYHDFNHDNMKNSNDSATPDFSLKESVYSARIEFIHSFK